MRKPQQLIDISKPGYSPSPVVKIVMEDNWSHFGTHERYDLAKKLKEQPRNNPIDPKTITTKEGGQ